MEDLRFETVPCLKGLAAALPRALMRRRRAAPPPPPNRRPTAQVTAGSPVVGPHITVGVHLEWVEPEEDEEEEEEDGKKGKKDDKKGARTAPALLQPWRWHKAHPTLPAFNGMQQNKDRLHPV